jgi:hypothetical protein
MKNQTFKIIEKDTFNFQLKITDDNIIYCSEFGKLWTGVTFHISNIMAELKPYSFLE